jgi:hypothetical protein
MRPCSGRCITKDRYIEILQSYLEPIHRYKILNFKNITWFKINLDINDKNTDKNICD